MGLGRGLGTLKNGPRFWVRADSVVKARKFLPAFVEFDCGDIYKLCLPLMVSKGGRVEYRRIKANGVMRHHHFTTTTARESHFNRQYYEWEA